MKRKKIWLLVLLMLPLILLTACQEDEKPNNDETQVTYYTVTFDSAGGSPVSEKKAVSGEKVSEPAVPQKEGYLFDGWMEEANKLWLFDVDTVTSDVTLTARWISAESVFGYRKLESGDFAVITELKKRNYTEVRVPSTLGGWTITGIDAGVFEGIGKADEEDEDNVIREISLPKTITSIGERAFADTVNVKITFEAGTEITFLGEHAFLNCNRLTEIPLGEGLQTVPFEAFSGCVALKELRLPQSVTKVEENACTDCKALVTVMLHADLLQVDNMAFDDCTALKAVYFYGTAEQADVCRNQKINSTNAPLIGAKWLLYSQTKPIETGVYDYWYLTENGSVKVW